MNNQIELLRGIAILAVIGVHTTMFFVGTKVITLLTFTNLYLDVIFHYAVPLFITISGYVLSLKYTQDFELKHFYLRRLGNILPPYLLTNLFFYILPEIYIYKSGSTVQEILYKLATFSTAMHFWFFIIIIELYLAYPLILRAYKYLLRRFDLKITLCLFFLVQVVSSIFLTGTDIFLKDIFYFILGMSLNLHKDLICGALQKLNAKILPAVTLLVSLCASYLWYNFYLVARDIVFMQIRGLVDTVLYSLIVVLLFFLTRAQHLYDNGISAFVSGVLGKYSFGIYLIHMSFLEALRNVLTCLEISSTEFIFYPLLFVSTLCLSLLSAYLLNKVPSGFLIMGKVKR